MKTLNLVYLENSDIKYQIQRFPDGQQNIVLLSVIRSFKEGDKESNITQLKQGFGISGVQIKSRLNNWLDLELIVCAVASLRELGVEEIHLYVPYIMGARSDRKFEEGGNNYLRDVLCSIINSLNFKTVTCIDPHSDVLEACIKGFRKIDNLKLLENALSYIYFNEPNKDISIRDKFKDFILVSPDAGASKKIYKLAEQIHYKGNIITCSKDRDSDGKLTKVVVPTFVEPAKKDIIIIDDICDGGATFINIAKAIKEACHNNKLYLIVTHGIFSKGLEELSNYFDGIYCTNSYKEFGLVNSSLVKHINVFT